MCAAIARSLRQAWGVGGPKDLNDVIPNLVFSALSGSAGAVYPLNFHCLSMQALRVAAWVQHDLKQ